MSEVRSESAPSDVDTRMQSEALVDERNRATAVDYSRLRIAGSRHWVWQLHENQSYLGRMIFVLRRPLTASAASCRQEEWSELRRQMIRYERLMTRLFHPDRFNYTQMGNEWPQLHVHAIPRYARPRDWSGVRFVDQRWGRNPSPKPAPPMGLEMTYRLAEWVRAEYVKNGRRRIRGDAGDGSESIGCSVGA